MLRDKKEMFVPPGLASSVILTTGSKHVSELIDESVRAWGGGGVDNYFSMVLLAISRSSELFVGS
jgi:hypothetical protein